ncbi:3-hydroxyacyl-ACP dehydratase FabZ [Paralimibaculum aggregatum]|uniref:3-hydroxyacyl-[acyl-carrier-protein] dehydratase FabZ n=1 Tax=Paralimibaculum aggregatum TaxID=3036245 RepID=A0ABQ6LRB7_9RHOB|nr:3-hydroxyacyl-ACP dehydratase FabZ [Limibaculum sp. NKW23]GMG83661.1 3-hydroxyacyl-ACP dehydratase FabZ [Limibaculum sp. NKW23]
MAADEADRVDERVADLGRIKRMIPHRYPFLLIDKVQAIRPHESAIGIKNVTANEPHFEGHFPQEAVMPGVLVVEAMAQTAGVLVVDSLGKEGEDLLVYFMTLDKTRFRKKVIPGDVLELHVKILRGRGKVFKFWGEARVGPNLVAEAEFSAMIIDKDDSRRSQGTA